MPLFYKKNILQALREAGYTTYKLRVDKHFSESTIQKFRKNLPVSWENIETLCNLLKCQPGDILIYSENDDK